MPNTRTTSHRRFSRFSCPARVRVHARVRGTVALAGLLAGGILLTGCSDSSNTTSPTPSDTSSTSPSPSATPTPTMTAYGTVEEQKASLPKSRDGMQTGAVMNRAVATNPEEEAVANAWLRHWQVRAKALMDAKADLTALDGVATEDAAERTIQHAKIHAKNKSYTEGVVILNPTRIIIQGNTATLLDCALDESRDVYSNGTQEQGGIVSVGVRATLKRSQGSWRTTKYTFDEKLCTNEGMEQG
jgi:hypothetical protein